MMGRVTHSQESNPHASWMQPGQATILLLHPICFLRAGVWPKNDSVRQGDLADGPTGTNERLGVHLCLINLLARELSL